MIDAFISTDIPEIYARTRYELVNLLKEFRSEAAKGGRTIEVNLYQDIELFSEDAALAEERFRDRAGHSDRSRKGDSKTKAIHPGRRLSIPGWKRSPFRIFEYGIPVEYELVRSINTVASGKRRTNRGRANRCLDDGWLCP